MAKRILIAEDEKPLANALGLKLGAQGYEVELAFDGEEAIQKLGNSKYDLIVLDLVMPKVSGFEVIESIRAKKIETPILVNTNLSQSEDSKRLAELGVNEICLKSDTSLATVVAKVKEMIK